MSNIPENFDPKEIDPLNQTLYQMQLQLWANSKEEDGLGTGTKVTDITDVPIDPNSTAKDSTAYQLALQQDVADQQKKPKSTSSANRALRNINNIQ